VLGDDDAPGVRSGVVRGVQRTPPRSGHAPLGGGRGVHEPARRHDHGRPVGHGGRTRCVADLWRTGLDAHPDLRFESRTLLVGHDSIALSYRNHRGQECAEFIVFGPDGRGIRGRAHDGPAGP